MKKRTKGWEVEKFGRGIKISAVFVRDYKGLLKALDDQPAEPSLIVTPIKAKRAKA